MNAPAADSRVFDVTQHDFEQKVLLASMQVPVLVDFWAPWCGPCKQLTPVLEKLVAEYGGRVLLAKVNTDEEMQLPALFGVRSLPTVLLIREGRPLDGFLGAQPEAAIRALLEPHLGPPADVDPEPRPEPALPADPTARVDALRARIAAEPDKPELNVELAQALLEAGSADEAEKVLDALSPAVAEGDAARRVRAALGFARTAAGAPARDELAARVAADPADLGARHLLGTRALLDGDHEDALEQFLEIMRRDRKFGDDAGRKSLVAAFALVDDADLVARTRRRMSSLLF